MARTRKTLPSWTYRPYDYLFKIILKKEEAPQFILSIVKREIRASLDTEFLGDDVTWTDMLFQLDNNDLHHIEIESSKTNDMARRMLDYRIAIVEREKRSPEVVVKQTLIYIGEPEWTPPDRVPAVNYIFQSFSIRKYKFNQGDARHWHRLTLGDHVMALLSLSNEMPEFWSVAAQRVRGDILARKPGAESWRVRLLI